MLPIFNTKVIRWGLNKLSVAMLGSLLAEEQNWKSYLICCLQNIVCTHRSLLFLILRVLNLFIQDSAQELLLATISEEKPGLRILESPQLTKTSFDPGNLLVVSESKSRLDVVNVLYPESDRYGGKFYKKMPYACRFQDKDELRRRRSVPSRRWHKVTSAK